MNTINLTTYRMRKQIREIHYLYQVRKCSPILQARYEDKLMAWHGEGTVEEAFIAFMYVYKMYI